jgi:hypothetical protein
MFDLACMLFFIDIVGTAKLDTWTDFYVSKTPHTWAISYQLQKYLGLNKCSFSWTCNHNASVSHFTYTCDLWQTDMVETADGVKTHSRKCSITTCDTRRREMCAKWGRHGMYFYACSTLVCQGLLLLSMSVPGSGTPGRSLWITCLLSSANEIAVWLTSGHVI